MEANKTKVTCCDNSLTLLAARQPSQLELEDSHVEQQFFGAQLGRLFRRIRGFKIRGVSRLGDFA